VKTYKALLDEKARLESLLASQHILIREDIKGLKDQFVPVSHAFTTIVKFFSPDKKNSIVSAGVNFAGDVLLKKFILARTGWLTKLVVPYLVKNYSSHLINKNLNKNGVNFLHKLGDRLKSDSTSSSKNAFTNRTHGTTATANQ
jgi:hypothetical protein